MAVVSYDLSRKKMVKERVQARGSFDKRVIAAMNLIPRHLFVDKRLWPQAYNDYPLVIGEGQTISQPYIVALMTNALKLTGNEKVLEIGTGSGYQTAILAKICAWVYSIERLPSLANRAQHILDQLGLFNISLIINDGSKGLLQEAPFDAIIVTAGGPVIPTPLLNQLADGGHLVMPVGDRHLQILYCLTRYKQKIIKKELGGCRFVNLIGQYGWAT